MGDSPTASKRWIGVALQRIREASGRSRQEAAERVGKVTAWAGHVEIGRNLPSAGDLEVLLTWYGRADLVPVFLSELRIAKQRDWWYEYREVVPDSERLSLGLETAAEFIDSYAISAIPELLRTREYASVLLQDPRRIADFQIERRLELMADRQKRLLDNTNTQIQIVLSEIALRQLVGDSDVMAAQIRYLVDVAELPNVTLRVLPLSGSALPEAATGFTVYRLSAKFEGDVTEVIYLGVTEGGSYRHEKSDAEPYGLAFARLIETAATEEESINLLEQMVNFLTN